MVVGFAQIHRPMNPRFRLIPACQTGTHIKLYKVVSIAVLNP